MTPLNYTPEQTDQIKIMYLANPTRETVKALAAQFGRTPSSIMAKLTKEQVYKPRALVSTPKRVMLKADMVAEISKHLEVSEELLESLAKASAIALQAVLSGLSRAKREGLASTEGANAAELG